MKIYILQTFPLSVHPLFSILASESKLSKLSNTVLRVFFNEKITDKIRIFVSISLDWMWSEFNASFSVQPPPSVVDTEPHPQYKPHPQLS